MSVQGGLDIGYVISDAATVYTGTWASNIDFSKFDTTEASTEFDAYAGVAGKILGIDWDLGGLGYIFPGEHDDDYAEVYGSLGHSFNFGAVQPSITVGVNFSPDNIRESNDAFYG